MHNSLLAIYRFLFLIHLFALHFALFPFPCIFQAFPYICIGNDQLKGTKSFPSSFPGYINMDPIIAQLEKKMTDLLAGDPSLFLVEIRIKPTNNFKIYIDGDQGVGIDQLTSFNRRLYRQLEEEGWFPEGNFSLELSSPGLDEPLKLHRQYVKNIGRNVEVVTKEGVKTEGKLLNAAEEAITIEEVTGKGKKMEIKQHVIPFETIKTTKIQVTF